MNQIEGNQYRIAARALSLLTVRNFSRRVEQVQYAHMGCRVSRHTQLKGALSIARGKSSAEERIDTMSERDEEALSNDYQTPIISSSSFDHIVLAAD